MRIANVNQYYLSSWSLTHFLMHGDHGRHAVLPSFLEAGADAPLSARTWSDHAIEAAWIPYFRAQASAADDRPD